MQRCKQRAKNVDARAVEFLTKCMKLTHDGPKTQNEKMGLAHFVCRKKSQDALTIFHATNERENKPLHPKGGAKKCGVTQQVRQKPQTHEQASHNYITTLVQQVL